MATDDSMEEGVVGMDVGTYSGLAYYVTNKSPKPKPCIVDGNDLFKSAVGLSENHPSEFAVGDSALGDWRRQRGQHSIHMAKLIIGMPYKDVQPIASTFPFDIVEGAGGMAYISVPGMKEPVSPMLPACMLVTAVLDSVRQQTSGDFKLNALVVTVPARFSEQQRQHTAEAANAALLAAGFGKTELLLINEPTAAAQGYFSTLKQSELVDLVDKNILVSDFGGGTYDVSVVALRSDDNGVYGLQVLATTGDVQLGGANVDQLLLHHIKQQLPTGHSGCMRAVEKEICTHKHKCQDGEWTVRFECVLGGDEHQVQLSPAILEVLLKAPISSSGNSSGKSSDSSKESFLVRTAKVISDAVACAGMDLDDIYAVMEVGGSSRLVAIRNMLLNWFPADKCPRATAVVDLDRAVAIGAVQYAVLRGLPSLAATSLAQEIHVRDVASQAVGVESVKTKNQDIFMDGESTHVYNSMSPVIERFLPLPVERSRTFYTSRDNQLAIRLKVFEGNSSSTLENKYLGKFDISVPPAPKSTQSITVTMEIDGYGLLTVSAKSSTEQSRKHSLDRIGSMVKRQDLAAMVLRQRIYHKHRGRDAFLAASNMLLNLVSGAYEVLAASSRHNDVLNDAFNSLAALASEEYSPDLDARVSGDVLNEMGGMIEEAWAEAAVAAEAKVAAASAAVREAAAALDDATTGAKVAVAAVAEADTDDTARKAAQAAADFATAVKAAAAREVAAAKKDLKVANAELETAKAEVAKTSAAAGAGGVVQDSTDVDAAAGDEAAAEQSKRQRVV